MVARRGHFWQWYRSRHETVRLHWAEGRGADESIGSTEPMRMEIAVCADCGLILATRSVHEGDGTYRHVQGYGFDLESLTIRGGAPPCDDAVLSRPPFTLEAA